MISTISGGRNTRICGEARIKCYKAAESNFNSESFRSFRDPCNCLPACTSIEYTADIDHVKFDQISRLLFWGYNSFEIKTYKQSTILSVNYKNIDLMTVNWEVLYISSDLMTICGGLLGLFLSVSALSIVKLIYFTTFLWFNFTRRSQFENIEVPPRQRVINVISVDGE